MKKIMTIIMLIMTQNSYAAEQETIDICSSFQPVFKEINERSPLKLDHMTTMISIHAVVIANNCQINSEYLINEDEHLKAYIQQGNSKEETIEYLNSEEARNETLNIIKLSTGEDIKKAVLRKDVNYSAQYKYDGNNLKGFEFKL